MAAVGLEAEQAVQRVARTSYGRLLAFLAMPSRDLAAAEDALSEAFVQALRHWPATGVPSNPEGWLLTVARNRLSNHFRAPAQRSSVPLEKSGGVDVAIEAADPVEIPDRRLALMFLCAHPGIDPAIRTPLMLQTVLGLEADRIALAFALPASTLAQRLVRAKRRIRDAGMSFAVPDQQDMSTRLPPVLEAIYGAYAIDWQVISGTTERDTLAGEALFLATLCAELLGEEPEALGLAALLSFSIARTKARVSSDGRFVPLEQQDVGKWDEALIAKAEALLHRAHASGRPGRFQIEAAIQSLHCARARTGSTDGRALVQLHHALAQVAPSLGAHVALAAAIGEAEGAQAGLAYLESLEPDSLHRFQPAWATRAHLLARSGNAPEARRAYERAISLTADPMLQSYLQTQSARLAAD